MPIRPNILWIYCDELRTDALGCYGHPTAKMRTPRIDELAFLGVRFNQCFCNSPVCVPSRTSTLTARYPEQTGVYHNEGVWGEKFAPPMAPMLTFPQALAQQGYATANFGKEHVPATLQPWQLDDHRGSDAAELNQALPKNDPTRFCPPGIPTDVGGVFPAGRPYPPNAVAAHTMAWMGKAWRPFLARASLLQPHTPVLPQPPFDQLYAAEPIDGVVPNRDRVSRFERAFGEVCGGRKMPAEQVRMARLHYYGLVAWIDTQVGLLVDFLRQGGLLESTIIVFDADHGASLGEGGCYGKHLFAPQTHRVPRIVTWAKTLAGGVVRDDLTDGIDLARTLMGLCGLVAPQEFEGRNLFADPAPEAVYATIGYGRPDSFAFPNLHLGRFEGEHGWPRRACVRTPRYRLDKTVRIDGREPVAAEVDLFLADVGIDPLETVNLAADPRHAATAARLEADLDRHLRQCAGAV